MVSAKFKAKWQGVINVDQTDPPIEASASEAEQACSTARSLTAMHRKMNDNTQARVTRGTIQLV
jgi:hypothetical protein